MLQIVNSFVLYRKLMEGWRCVRGCKRTTSEAIFDQSEAKFFVLIKLGFTIDYYHPRQNTTSYNFLLAFRTQNITKQLNPQKLQVISRNQS